MSPLDDRAESAARLRDELATYDRVVARYGDSDERELVEEVATALSKKGHALRNVGRLEEALVLYDSVVARDVSVADGRVSMPVALTMIDRAVCLAELDRLAEAIEASRETADYLEEASEPRLVELAIRARINEAIFVGRDGDTDTAIGMLDVILAIHVDLDDVKLVEDALRASACRATILQEIGRVDEALEGLRAAIWRFADVPSTRGRNYLASTLAVYAKALGDSGRGPDAIAAYDQAVGKVDRDATLEFREQAGGWSIEKGNLLRDAGDRVGAAKAYRDVFDRIGSDPEGQLPRLASWAGFEAACLVHRFFRPEEALGLAQLIVARFGGSDDPYVRERVECADLMARGIAQRMRILHCLGLSRRR
jgi:tetratricopeptide (TPR) repeat protein